MGMDAGLEEVFDVAMVGGLSRKTRRSTLLANGNGKNTVSAWRDAPACVALMWITSLEHVQVLQGEGSQSPVAVLTVAPLPSHSGENEPWSRYSVVNTVQGILSVGTGKLCGEVVSVRKCSGMKRKVLQGEGRSEGVGGWYTVGVWLW